MSDTYKSEKFCQEIFQKLNNLEFLVAVCYVKGKSKDYEKLTKGFRVIEFTPEKLHKAFSYGFATTSKFEKDGKFHRAKKNFVEGSVIQLDFDNKDLGPGDPGYFSLDELLNQDTERARSLRDTAFGFYTTNSHRKNKDGEGKKDRFRVYFIAENPITSLSKYESILRGLRERYPTIDPQCVEGARYYYGMGEGGEIGVFGNILTEQQIKHLIEQVSIKETKETNLDSSIPLDDVEKTETDIEDYIEDKLNELSKATLGDRHKLTRNTAIVISKKIYSKDLNYWNDFEHLVKDRIRKTALTLKKYDTKDNVYTKAQINRDIDDGWNFILNPDFDFSDGGSTSQTPRLYKNKPIPKMDTLPRDIIFSCKPENVIDQDGGEGEIERIDRICREINDPESRKRYLAIWKFADCRVITHLKDVKFDDIIALMYAGMGKDIKDFRYERNILIEKIDLFANTRFKFNNPKTGIDSFPLIGQYHISPDKTRFSCILPMPISNFAVYFPENIYSLKSKNFNLDFELWLNANRHSLWTETPKGWKFPNYERKPIKLTRGKLIEYADLESIKDKYRQNQKLKTYLENIKDLGHIKTAPNISGVNNDTYAIYMKNYYRVQSK